ncbi:hypothetical protein BT69DRAFT_1287029 [Atractiella rhizophila]|nr:hypothetical protein BT69DRAFT_1287029 [Atractiella rhizophila]
MAGGRFVLFSFSFFFFFSFGLWRWTETCEVARWRLLTIRIGMTGRKCSGCLRYLPWLLHFRRAT